MEKKIIFFAWLFLLLYSTLSFGQAADVKKLKELNKKFLDAIVNRDTASLSYVLAEDFILINPGGIKRDKADNLAGILLPDQKVLSVGIDSVEVRLLSDKVGLVTAWTTNIVIANEKKTSFQICYQDVYMKRKEKWQAVSAHVSLLHSQ